ncbi:spermidine synthase [Caerostris extrusa]|uniref:Spermidine synthase n=1 Tax=Caerostris extrusa TaxID=172846 RepID=A0AAV4W8W2_CAEEX|nr:spermidine synthase [Caerostris extrusa]
MALPMLETAKSRRFQKRMVFRETGSVNADQALSIKVEKVLMNEKSKYQDVLVFETKKWGRVLVLDDSVQCTELDEFSYQEMVSFIPLNSHPNPKNNIHFPFQQVLVIGGGDGGVVREVSKHPLVESVTLCELDEKVIEASKKYLPFMSKGFESPKLTLHIKNGVEFMQNHQNEFDLKTTHFISGPAACLFQKPYYESLKRALKPGGIVISQGESFWYDKDLVTELLRICRSIFPVVDYGVSYVTSFPAGQIGYLCCSTNPVKTNFRQPINVFSYETMKELKLKYYTPDVHRGTFALPFGVAQDLGLKWEVSTLSGKSS